MYCAVCHTSHVPAAAAHAVCKPCVTLCHVPHVLCHPECHVSCVLCLSTGPVLRVRDYQSHGAAWDWVGGPALGTWGWMGLQGVRYRAHVGHHVVVQRGSATDPPPSRCWELPGPALGLGLPWGRAGNRSSDLCSLLTLPVLLLTLPAPCLYHILPTPCLLLILPYCSLPTIIPFCC